MSRDLKGQLDEYDELVDCYTYDIDDAERARPQSTEKRYGRDTPQDKRQVEVVAVERVAVAATRPDRRADGRRGGEAGHLVEAGRSQGAGEHAVVGIELPAREEDGAMLRGKFVKGQVVLYFLYPLPAGFSQFPAYSQSPSPAISHFPAFLRTFCNFVDVKELKLTAETSKLKNSKNLAVLDQRA